MPLDFTISIPPGVRAFGGGLFNRPSLPPVIANVDALTVSNWIRKYNDQFFLFEKTVSNGIYPVLEKKVDEITPLLKEGLSIACGQSSYSGVVSLINDLMKPRLAKLEAVYSSAKQKVADHAAEKAKDVKLAKLWRELNLPLSILENHADCARFFIESGVAFPVVGFRETGRRDHDLRLDPVDGHPMLKMQGRWTRWETVTREVYYNTEAEQIKSRNDANKYWNYYHPDGLVLSNRFDIPHRFPIYELTQEEYDKVLQHALKFYETNPERDPGIPKGCVVQFFSSPRRKSLVKEGSFLSWISGSPLLDNVYRNIPVHVGVRIITPDKKVYSFGVHAPPDQQNQLLSDFFSTYVMTANAKIPMVDYEEFRKHEGRMVTSIPLTSERASKILDRVDELNGKQMRLQYMRQNCSQFTREALRISGYDVDIRTTGLDFLITLFPSLTQIPIIAKVCSYTAKFWNNLPVFLTKPIEFTWTALFYVPRKIGTIFTNLLALKMGGAKQTTPLQEGLEDEEFYDKKEIQSFSKLIRSWTDIFKDETDVVYHTKAFLDWQKEQKSTFIEKYSGRPKLTIVPPTT